MGQPDQFILFRDSSGVWCAAPPGFRDLVLDPTGWGPTREEAILALLDQPEFLERQRVSDWPRPRFGDFVEVNEPAGAQVASITHDPGETDGSGESDFHAAVRRQSFR